MNSPFQKPYILLVFSVCAVMLFGRYSSAAPRGEEALLMATEVVALGPHSSGTPGSAAVRAWVADQLEMRGWTPQSWSGDWSGGEADGVLACRGSGPAGLFFAHVDTVHSDVPGANDNAAAIGVLLELATRLPDSGTLARRVCLAFPDGEEIGTVGSGNLQELGLVGDIDWVVALDLVGRGTVTYNGLGPNWSREDARMLLKAAPADVPWIYRAISHAVPEGERSDHRPWALAGYRAAHIFARAESGVYWAYHTPLDTPEQLQVTTLAAMVERLEGLVGMPQMPGGNTGDPWFVVPFTGRYAASVGVWVVPGWVTQLLALFAIIGAWLGLARGVRSGPDKKPRARPKTPPNEWNETGLVSFARVLFPLIVAGLCFFFASAGRSFHADRALPVVLAGWGAWLATTAAVGPWRRPVVPIVLTFLGTVVLAVLIYFGAILLAFPGCIALLAAGSLIALRADLRHRWWTGFLVLIAAWPAAYGVSPPIVRELAFHKMYPAEALGWAPLFALLVLPLSIALPLVMGQSRRLATMLSVMTVLFIVWAWILPVATGVFDVPEQLFPLPRPN